MCRNQVFLIFANNSRSKQNEKNLAQTNIIQWLEAPLKGGNCFRFLPIVNEALQVCLRQKSVPVPKQKQVEKLEQK